MKLRHPTYLGINIYLLDSYDLGVPGRTGIYIIKESDLTLIESGPSPSFDHIKNGLSLLGFELADIKYIILTHIHLDHAGGIGKLLAFCPHAKVMVHPRGSRHLVHPEKLIAGAKAVYEESFTKFFDPVLPVAADRILEKKEGDELKLSTHRTLKFFDTPGHAKHHLSIYDPLSNGIFTGDTVGIRYEQLAKEDIDLFLPTTSPNQFDPLDMQKQIERILHMNVDYILFGHYGMTTNVTKALEEVSNWLTVFMEIGATVYKNGGSEHVMADNLLKKVRQHLRKYHVSDDHEVYEILAIDMEVCAMGIFDYFERTA